MKLVSRHIVRIARVQALVTLVALGGLCAGAAPALAQTARDVAEKELARKPPPGSVQACSLITRADVQKATGRNPYADPEPAGQGGWICSVGIVELKVYSGANSLETWESTVKKFKMDKDPRKPAAAFGDGAYFLYQQPRNSSQDNTLMLVARSGLHTVVLSLDPVAGQPADSVRAPLETLMKLVLARLK